MKSQIEVSEQLFHSIVPFGDLTGRQFNKLVPGSPTEGSQFNFYIELIITNSVFVSICCESVSNI